MPGLVSLFHSFTSSLSQARVVGTKASAGAIARENNGKESIQSTRAEEG
jgi:hypothetical protein